MAAAEGVAPVEAAGVEEEAADSGESAADSGEREEEGTAAAMQAPPSDWERTPTVASQPTAGARKEWTGSVAASSLREG